MDEKINYMSLGYESEEDMVLDYINNFLTIQGFADYHDITKNDADILISEQDSSYKRTRNQIKEIYYEARASNLL